MSLVRLATRIATVKALKNRTWAEDRVSDSQIAPIDDTDGTQGDKLPFIAVYTDDTTQSIGKHSEGSLTLIIETGITARSEKVTSDPVTPGTETIRTIEWVIPTTDAGIELTLDIMERQIIQALMDPDDVWGDLWKSLFLTQDSIQSLRGTSYKDGVRFAGRQIKITGTPLPEPAYGRAPSGKWADFIALVTSDPDLLPIETILKAAFGENEAWPSWKIVQDYFALPSSDMDALQLVPPDGVGDVTIVQPTQDSIVINTT